MRDLLSDRELAQRAAGGDEASWREIYDATCDRLFSFLRYQVGNRDEALDLLQETYLKAFRSLGDYRGEAPLASWLRTIALRKSLDWRRGALQRLRRNVELTEEVGIVEEDRAEVRFDSERAAIHGALATLSASQRAALLLREWEGWSFREIAEALRCKESTARVHHTRARERMRLALGESAAPLEARGLEGQES